MITNQNIKSGADIEILLGSQYIQRIIETFYESKMIPESLTTAEGFKIEIPQPSNVQIVEGSDKDIQLTFAFKYFNPDGTRNTMAPGPSRIYAKLHLLTNQDDKGLIRDLRVKLEVTDFNGSLESLRLLANIVIENDAEDRNPGGDHSDLLITKESILEQLNANLGQEYPLNIFGRGKQIRDFKTTKFASNNETEKAIGIYINLVMQKGPEEFNVYENTINLNEAVNFLPEDQAIAFGMNEGMFDRMSSTIKQGFAEEKTPGEGDWHYPLKEGKETKGKIRSVKISPWQKPVWENGQVARWEMENGLMVKLTGEVYVDELDIKPDFEIFLGLKPEIVNGKVEWRSELVDSDVDLTFWETTKLSFAVGFIFFAIFAFFTGPFALLIGGIAAGITMAVADPLADLIGEGMIGDMYKKYVNASLFDTIPDRVTTVVKRWDPFYNTLHQVVSHINHLAIDHEGFSIAATATTGTEVEPVESCVFRNEIRNSNDEIQGFEIRVKDYQRIDASVINNFYRIDPENQPDLFALSLGEIRTRKNENKFRPSLQFFYPYKIDKESNSIRRILAISETEKKEIENKYLLPHLREKSDWFETNCREATLVEVRAALKKKLGRNLNDNDDKEVTRRYNEKKKEWLEEREMDYRRGALKPLYNNDVENSVMLDMHPNEFGNLQVDGLLAMVHTYRLIYMKNTGRFYYRTKKNITTSDNLGSLAEYESMDETA